MSNEAWKPLGFDDEAAGLEGPHEGVPSWLSASLWDWIDEHFWKMGGTAGFRIRVFKSDLARKIERVCRITISYTGDALEMGRVAVRNALLDVDKRLRVVDFLLAAESTPEQAAALDAILLEAGSVWSVGPRRGAIGLVRRVSPALTAAAEQAIVEGHAGDRLSEAWNAAFGLNPDPSRAFSLAVKAIEDAAIPIVAPNDATTTLGKVIGQIKSDNRWTLPFQRDDSEISSGQALVGVLKSVWAGQVDRHGGVADPASNTTAAVSQAAAETAVVLAVAVVHLFATEKVIRKA